jgi:hypothetical protein
MRSLLLAPCVTFAQTGGGYDLTLEPASPFLTQTITCTPCDPDRHCNVVGGHGSNWSLTPRARAPTARRGRWRRSRRSLAVPVAAVARALRRRRGQRRARHATRRVRGRASSLPCVRSARRRGPPRRRGAGVHGRGRRGPRLPRSERRPSATMFSGSPKQALPSYSQYLLCSASRQHSIGVGVHGPDRMQCETSRHSDSVSPLPNITADNASGGMGCFTHGSICTAMQYEPPLLLIGPFPPFRRWESDSLCRMLRNASLRT